MPNAVHEIVPFGGGSIMVWGGMTINTRRDLVVIRNGGKWWTRRYMNEILEPQLIRRANVVAQNFILMQDNARLHIAHIVTDYLDDHNIRKMIGRHAAQTESNRTCLGSIRETCSTTSKSSNYN
jgi:hypothetical protein